MGNLQIYEVHKRLIPPLLWMQERGMKVDVERMKRRSEELKQFVEEQTRRLHEIAGRELNPRSSKQIIEYFWGKGAVYKDRKTGRPTADEEALKRLARRGFEEASIIREIRRAEKLRSSYLEVKLGEGGRLRGMFGFARSGRLTSSQDIFGEGLNTQTLPVAMKDFIIADEGFLLYNLDKAQAENRIVAYIAPDENMISAFERGEDIHRKTASYIFGKPPEEISSEEGSCKLGSGTRSERYFGKEANHALNYGLGPETFALRLEISRPEAEFIINRYFTAYPGVKNYHRWVREKVARDGTLENLFGRKYFFVGGLSDASISDALYFIPQSTVADLINQWGLLFIWENRESLFNGLELLNQVHDAIVFQIPIELGWMEHWRMLSEIVNSLNRQLHWEGRSFHIPTDVKIGRRMSKMIELKSSKLTEENFREAFNDALQSE